MSTTEQERAKYQRMWQFAQYRKHSPGAKHVQAAIDYFGIAPGDSVIDFGCGTGRAAMAFHRVGIQVFGVDIADNCLDPQSDWKLPFYEACLWELPDDLPEADYGYCTDVMEHIPTERVADVLRAIKSKCRKGAFFQVCCRADGCGSLIGETLHLTVQPPHWWFEQFTAVWDEVDMSGETDIVVKVR